MTAYYNEHDPFAAAWLRQLIEYGHIAPGIVDERSIEDVTPADLDGFTQCHFFAGIGVWSYALRLAGWPDDRPIWTASCPCQPFSAAGKGGGFDDERHLWPALHWHISQCRPEIIIGEQVASKDGLAWWELVSSDLEIAGYANAAVDFCAASVGAPHIRQRLYWMAHAASSGSGSGLRDSRSTGQWGNIAADGSRLIRLDDTIGARLEGFGSGYQAEIGRDGTSGPVAQTGESGGLADATGGRLGVERRPIEQGNIRHADGGGDASGGMAVTERVGRQGIFGESGSGMDRGTSPTNGFWRNVDWVFCRGGKWRPVEPSYVKVVNGTAASMGRMRDNSASANAQETQEIIRPSPLARNEIARTQRLRGYGNAIVAPQAATFIQTVMEIL